MYNKNSILASAKSLVGFREDNSDTYDELTNTATASVTDTFVFVAIPKTITWANQDFEAEGFEVGQTITVNTTLNAGTYTIANVNGNVITTVEAIVAETIGSGTITSVGQLQTSTSQRYVNDLPGVNFEVISAAISNDAVTSKDYLIAVVQSETIQILDKFVNRMKDKYNSRELLGNSSIVSGVQPFTNKVTQNARFVGYWFRPHASNNLDISITQLGMQSDTTQSNLKVYLYVTSQIEPLSTFTFNVSTASSVVWQTVTDFTLRYESETTGTGQEYLVGYYEQDANNVQPEQLQGQAHYMTFDCGCSGSPKSKYGQFMGIYPIEIPNQYLNWNGTLYDIPLVDNVANYVSGSTYGLLAKVNVRCDLTTILNTNIDIFSEALQYAIAVRLLYDAYASNRINSITDSKREQAKAFAMKYDGMLNGYTTPDGVKVKGLIDNLNADFSTLDSYCLPCSEGIKTGYLISY